MRSSQLGQFADAFAFFPRRNLSFYKEELGGDKRNYLLNRAMASGVPILAILQDVANETVEAATRASQILEGRGAYQQSMLDGVRGLLAMHTTNPRYKLGDLGLAEAHPLLLLQ